MIIPWCSSLSLRALLYPEAFFPDYEVPSPKSNIIKSSKTNATKTSSSSKTTRESQDQTITAPQVSQTIPNHPKPSQTIPNHPKHISGLPNQRGPAQPALQSHSHTSLPPESPLVAHIKVQVSQLFLSQVVDCGTFPELSLSLVQTEVFWASRFSGTSTG